MIADPPQKLDGDESYVLSSCYGPPMEIQSIAVISKMVLKQVLKRWDEYKTQSRPSSTSITPEEHISLKFFGIILK